jgi:hypothetical protein
MNITDQFQQVRVLFAQDGFITVLEKVAAAAVAQIIPDSIACQKPPHDGRQRGTASLEQKVEVVGNQRPGIASCLTPAQDRSQAVKEIVSILITEKDLLPSNSTPDDMMQSPWGIYPTLSRHANILLHPSGRQIIK